ncbi:MAG: AsmA-like C-terminal region-containing protein [Bacteroidales bacterium]|nr:AsmA-like C-terminal region-containing protein [Bacteroidales bacterium]
MKTFFKILAVIIVILLLAIILLPYVFKGKIIELAKQEINKQVTAQVDFTDIDFTLIRSFPNFSLTIDNMSVVGKGDFQGDTLAFISGTYLSFNMMDVFGGNYEVSKISLNRPRIFVWVKPDGKANYDIAVPTESTENTSTETEETDNFSIHLNMFAIVDGRLTYRDDETQMRVEMTGINHTLHGDLGAARTTLFTQTSCSALTVGYEGTNYLNSVALRYQANLDADLENSIYTFGKNELVINNLKLNFDGSVSMPEEGINMVLTYNAPSTEFKELLSLIPSVYLKDYQGLEATGKFSLNGAVNGLYTENRYPSFSLNLEVQNATLKYPELPRKITNIGLKTAIKSPGGDLDQVVVDVQSMHLEMGKNPVDIKLKLATPISDPNIDCNLKGSLDLSTVKDYYPIDSTDLLNGYMMADITLKGKLSSIENQQYDQFLAMGSMVMKGIEYASPNFKNPVTISQVQLNFSPQYIDLVTFDLKTGKSDLQASGKLENYLAYYLKDETLKGNMNVKSSYFNLDDVMDTTTPEPDEIGASTPETGTLATVDTSALVPEIPGNIHFLLITNFEQLIYDKLDMRQVTGRLLMADKKLQLQNLSMNISGGEMIVSGDYSTTTPKTALSTLKLNLNNLDIPTAFKQFAFFRTYLPLAEKATGKCSAILDFTTALDAGLMPIYPTLNGKGWMSANNLKVTGMNTLVKAAELLHYEELANLTLEKVLVEFKFVDGKLIVDPFDLKYQGVKGTLQGWTALDGKIGYDMLVEIPRKKLGSDANQLLDNLVGEANKLGANFSIADNIPFALVIGGTLENPTVSVRPGKGSSKETVKETVKEVINQEIDKQKENLKAEAQKLIEDADKQASKIIAEAEKQAAALRQNAVQAKSKLMDEAKKQSDKLIAEGKKNGMLGEMAARKASATVMSEAEKQAQNGIHEANKQADAIVNTAKASAVKIKADARKKADEMRK